MSQFSNTVGTVKGRASGTYVVHILPMNISDLVTTHDRCNHTVAGATLMRAELTVSCCTYFNFFLKFANKIWICNAIVAHCVRYVKLTWERLVEETRKTRVPMEVIFLIDESGSMTGSKWKAAIEGAMDILGLLHPHDIVGFYTFDHRLNERKIPTRIENNDMKNAFTNFLQGLIPLGGGTKLHDAVMEVGEKFSPKKTNGGRGENYEYWFFILTDGESHGDTKTVDQVAEYLLNLKKSKLHTLHVSALAVFDETVDSATQSRMLSCLQKMVKHGHPSQVGEVHKVKNSGSALKEKIRDITVSRYKKYITKMVKTGDQLTIANLSALGIGPSAAAPGARRVTNGPGSTASSSQATFSTAAAPLSTIAPSARTAPSVIGTVAGAHAASLSYDSTTTLYVSKIPSHSTHEEIADAFRRYGKLCGVDVIRGRSPKPDFAFVKFEHASSASKALNTKKGAITVRGDAVNVQRYVPKSG